jgi:hypothetical protein
MIAEPTKPEEIRVFRRFVPMIGLLAAWGIAVAAEPARAQVNIDQGKSPAEIFSGDCGTCHKTAKGLANGRNAGALAGFLREHYTSSGQQAASLAAYVLGAGSGPAPSAGLKPGTGGEQKTGEAKPGDGKLGEAKPGEKTAAHPGRPEAGATAKLPQPDQDAKSEAEPAAAEPALLGAGRKPAALRHEPRAVTASRGPKQEPEVPPPAPQAAPVVTPESASAPVATAPASAEPGNPEPANSEASAPAVSQPAVSQPALPATATAPSAVPDSTQVSGAAAPAAAVPSVEATSSTSAAAPAESQPSDGEPVPRDDIPD